jgi:hypothetical protein
MIKITDESEVPDGSFCNHINICNSLKFNMIIKQFYCCVFPGKMEMPIDGGGLVWKLFKCERLLK